MMSMRRLTNPCLALAFLTMGGMQAVAAVGDPQLRTDHPWYPGELAVSTFERLFETQAEIFDREVGLVPATDEQKALAAWYWRNTHYWHGEAGKQDPWGEGLNKGRDLRPREYWNGLFGYGFGLCGTTHSQWTAELDALLGHGRSRGVGMLGHNALEVFLTGSVYGAGRWALLDHDLSTVVFDPTGTRLLSAREVSEGFERLTDRNYLRGRQRGWLVCGLHPNDGRSYAKCSVAEYLAGYAGPVPMVNLRRGERFRRYFEPGLEDGDTYVYWGRSYNSEGIPGPERSRTWVNQPEAMLGSKTGTPHRAGQVRFGNAESVWRPPFDDGGYKDGVVREGPDYVVLEFQTPYIIGATPPDRSPWGIYKDGCRNGLQVSGKARCLVAVSVDRGARWIEGGSLDESPDLTDAVKGRQQYWLRFGAGAKDLRDAAVEIRTVCQLNIAILPRLKDGGTEVTFEASGRAVVSAGPGRAVAAPHIIDGAFDTPRVMMELASPRGEPIRAIHAAAHVASSNPPDPRVKYQIEFSLDGGQQWRPIVKDWNIPRRGEEPGDFWSQSLCYGVIELPEPATGKVWVRFRNDGGKRYLRAEAHLVYEPDNEGGVEVEYAWQDDSGMRRNVERVADPRDGRVSWNIPTGANVKTKWVEIRQRNFP